jgi:hypothetical protein
LLPSIFEPKEISLKEGEGGRRGEKGGKGGEKHSGAESRTRSSPSSFSFLTYNERGCSIHHIRIKGLGRTLYTPPIFEPSLPVEDCGHPPYCIKFPNQLFQLKGKVRFKAAQQKEFQQFGRRDSNPVFSLQMISLKMKEERACTVHHTRFPSLLYILDILPIFEQEPGGTNNEKKERDNKGRLEPRESNPGLSHISLFLEKEDGARTVHNTQFISLIYILDIPAMFDRALPSWKTRKEKWHLKA